MGKIVKLILISGLVNSNKFYHMTENTDNTFKVEFGRVGANPQTQTYPMSKWDATYKSKTKKGYKDNTDLFIVENVDTKDTGTKIKDFISTRSSSVVSLVKKLQAWATGSVEKNYTVSAENVTEKQVVRAQEVLDSIVNFDLSKTNIKTFNSLLLEFYGIVPRKMKNVKLHLINEDDNLTDTKNKIIIDEQATLDVMVGQVKLNTPNLDINNDGVEDVQTDMIKASGLEIVEVTDKTIIDQIKKLMGSNSNQFKEAYEVINIKTQSLFGNHLTNVKNKITELFWHGSRNENWWSIMTSGLIIRPSNAVHTGSMFGNSIYFASKCQKSIGYTSRRGSYWAKGNSDEAILALYDVHVGEQKHIYKHDSSCYKLSHDIINKDGFDSVYAHGGADLRNDEFMVYQAKQCTIKYLVIIKD
jgi:poly [ADP-ribose] polymerase